MLGICGCQDPLEGLAEATAGPSVSLESGDALEDAPLVPRLVIDVSSNARAAFGVEALELFEGELSSHSHGQVVQGELPDSLLERRVPMLSWQARASELLAQPTEVLKPLHSYSLVAVGVGLLARLWVRAEDAPVLTRVWPAPQSVGGAWGGVYCTEASVRLTTTSILLAPDAGTAELLPVETGADQHCLTMRVKSPAPVRVPAAEVPGMVLDPAPLTGLPSDVTPLPIQCVEACTPLGPGCACPEDDRVVVRGPEAPVFWMLGGQMGATKGGSSVVVSGLVPAAPLLLAGNLFDLSGRSEPVSASLMTQAPRPRLLINEVYANALGPEPEQEWVELVNAGTAPVALLGYVLEDAGGETPLPDSELRPGEFALVINDSYRAEPDRDVPFAATAKLLPVERLGKSGLANAGEALRLRAPEGQFVSRFPSTPPPKAGISVARRTLHANDDDADGFGLHAEPGASPGAPNQLSASE